MDVATIPGLLALRAAGSTGPWLRFEDDTWSAADVVREVDRHAVGLAERGVVSGDRVAMLLGNHPQTLFSWFAANRLGAIAAPLNPAYTPSELSGLMRLMTPRVLVVDHQTHPLAAAACEVLDDRDRPRLARADALARSGEGAPSADVSPDDVAVLLATSGTTGMPKAVMQSHRTYVLTAEAFPAWIGLTEVDRVLVPLPLFHVNAQAYSVMGALGCGAGLSLLSKFSASRFWEEARRHDATQFNAVGAMISILLATAPRSAEREHRIRLCYAALALPEPKHRAFEDRFGVEMTVGYGLSETTFGTIWPRSGARPYETIGVLRQHPRQGTINSARVVTEDGRDADVDEIGELLLRNPATMSGYFRDAEATAAAFDRGFLRTGDLVRKSDRGVYTFVARKKDVLRRRGENVAAAEIEGVLASHPCVLEAAAVGRPSPLGEDEIVAYVVFRAGRDVDVADVRAFAAERLAAFKVPSVILVRDSLPRTPTQRIAKHLLK